MFLPNVQPGALKMEKTQLEKIQVEFLKCVQDLSWISTEELAAQGYELPEMLTDSTRHRLHVYRTGYYVRVTQNLAQSLYSPLSDLVGTALVESLLGQYFEKNPATHPLLAHAADNAHAFLHTLEECQQHAWIPDAFFYCTLRWKVLTGEDPGGTNVLDLAQVATFTEDDLRTVFLVPSRSCLVSQFPLYDLMIESRERTSRVVEIDLSQAQGILMCKVSAFDFVTLRLHPDLFECARALCKGASLGKALEAFPAQGAFSEQLLGAFVAQLAEQRMLRIFCKSALPEVF